MEPEPAVGLNNAEARLAGQEEQEEYAVLSRLSDLVARHADALLEVRQKSVVLSMGFILVESGQSCFVVCKHVRPTAIHVLSRQSNYRPSTPVVLVGHAPTRLTGSM